MISAWLVQRGGPAYFRLLSRSGRVADEGVAASLAATAACISTAMADAGSPTDTSGSLEAEGRRGPALQAVLHAAGVLADSLLDKQSAGSFRRATCYCVVASTAASPAVPASRAPLLVPDRKPSGTPLPAGACSLPSSAVCRRWRRLCSASPWPPWPSSLQWHPYWALRGRPTTLPPMRRWMPGRTRGRRAAAPPRLCSGARGRPQVRRLVALHVCHTRARWPPRPPCMHLTTLLPCHSHQAWPPRRCCAACSASARAASAQSRDCWRWRRCCVAAPPPAPRRSCRSWLSTLSCGAPTSSPASLPSLLSWRPSWRLRRRCRGLPASARRRRRAAPASLLRRRPTLLRCGSRSSERWRPPSCRSVVWRAVGGVGSWVGVAERLATGECVSAACNAATWLLHRLPSLAHPPPLTHPPPQVVGSAVGDDEPLMSAGLDSLASVEFANVLGQKLGLQVGGWVGVWMV